MKPTLLMGGCSHKFCISNILQCKPSGFEQVQFQYPNICHHQSQMQLFERVNCRMESTLFWEAAMQELWHLFTFEAANWICGCLMDPSYILRRQVPAFVPGVPVTPQGKQQELSHCTQLWQQLLLCWQCLHLFVTAWGEELYFIMETSFLFSIMHSDSSSDKITVGPV